MSELRHDPIQRRWVIIATDRSKRPNDFAPDKAMISEPAFCPFCPGNETKTPPEITALRPDGSAPDTPGWLVRVVPNKFPALMIEGDLERKGVGIYDRMRGIGAHEVVIEGTEHEQSLADMSHDQVTRVMGLLRDRQADLMRDPRFKYVLLFKNHGASAGASLAHTHTQIIATPVTPRTVAVELDTARAHHHVKERCLYCDIIDQEIEDGRRIVYLDSEYVAFAPYASRFPFEIMLAPRKHRHQFTDASPSETAGLARAMKDVLSRLKASLGDPSYNFMFHTAPNTDTTQKRSHYWETLVYDYHWHVEILPRLTKVAGFEWGTGFYINPTAPEEAARFLREVQL